MSLSSQIFEVMLSPEEFEQMQAEKEQLLRANEKMAVEIEDLNKKLKVLTTNGDQILDNPKKIHYLSRKVLQLSKLLLKYQQSYQQLKASNAGKQTINNKIQASQGQITLASFNHLVSQNELLKAKLKCLQQEYDEKRIQAINERNIMEEQSNKLKKIESILAQKEEAFKKRQRQCAQRYEALQVQLLEKYTNSEEQLKKQLKQKSEQLQEKYIKQIASIQKIQIYEEKDMAQIRSELQKFQEQNLILYKKLKKAKQQKEQAVNQLAYFKECYQNVQNIDQSIVNLYAQSLLSFKRKLAEAGESNITAKVQQKKNQMLSALQQRIKQTIS